MRIIGLLLMAVAGAGLTGPALALTLSCHLGTDNVVISLDPDEVSPFEHMRAWGGVAAIEHMKTWRGVAAISEGAYRIWLDEGYDPAPDPESPGRHATPKELAEMISAEPYLPDLYLEIDRYTGRANAHWGDGQKFFGKSQNCRIVDKQLF